MVENIESFGDKELEEMHNVSIDKIKRIIHEKLNAEEVEDAAKIMVYYVFSRVDVDAFAKMMIEGVEAFIEKRKQGFEYVPYHYRKRKGGKRKIVYVKGYWRKPMMVK